MDGPSGRSLYTAPEFQKDTPLSQSPFSGEWEQPRTAITEPRDSPAPDTPRLWAKAKEFPNLSQVNIPPPVLGTSYPRHHIVHFAHCIYALLLGMKQSLAVERSLWNLQLIKSLPDS